MDESKTETNRRRPPIDTLILIRKDQRQSDREEENLLNASVYELS